MLSATLFELLAFLLDQFAVQRSKIITTRGENAARFDGWPDWLNAILSFRHLVALFFCLLGSVYCLFGLNWMKVSIDIKRKMSTALPFMVTVGRTAVSIYNKVPWVYLLLLILPPVGTMVVDGILYQQQGESSPGWSFQGSVAAGALSLLALLFNFGESHTPAAKAKQNLVNSSRNASTTTLVGQGDSSFAGGGGVPVPMAVAGVGGGSIAAPYVGSNASVSSFASTVVGKDDDVWDSKSMV